MKTKLAPKYIFIGIWFALMMLLSFIYGLAQFNLGGAETSIILALAAIQMILVLMFFMRLRTSAKLVRLVAAVGFLWLCFLFILAFSDYLTRQWH